MPPHVPSSSPSPPRSPLLAPPLAAPAPAPAPAPLQTPFEFRLYELRITAGPDYPLKPPVVRFVSRINLQYVNQSSGMVEKELPQLAGWHRNMKLEDVLVGLKNSMTNPHNRRLPQPPEGAAF